MNVDVLLRQRPVIPRGTIPVGALVFNVGAIHVANVLEVRNVEGQLGLVRAPGAVRRVILREVSKQAVEALINPRLNHELRLERADFVVIASALALRVQSVRAEQKVKWSEFERVHIDLYCYFNEVEMKSQGEAAKYLVDELWVGRQERIPVNCVEEEGRGPRQSHLHGGFL